MSHDTELDLNTCGCCEDEAAPPVVFNTPGLSALRYRVGTHAEFRDRMLRAMPAERPLARLTIRSSDDATVALLDSVATVADILTFYQERIANEGFLRTATERRSVLELARAIGYELSPGVAASTYLSFTVEDAAGSPLQSLVPKGTAVQSVPPQGKLPQIFETSNELLVRAEWNAMRPRLTRPADMAILEQSTTDRRLVLLVPADSVPAGENVFPQVTEAQVRRLDGSLSGSSSGELDAVEVKRLYFTESAAGLNKGELLLFAGGEAAQRVVIVLRVADVVPEPERKRIRVDVEALVGGSFGAMTVAYRMLPFLNFARVRLSPLAFNSLSVTNNITTQTWRERDLRALIGIQRWSSRGLLRAVNAPARPPLAPPASGAFAFREKAGFFGSTAPKWSTLPKPNFVRSNSYPLAWDNGDGAATEDRTIWENSQGTDNPPGGPHTFLERSVAGVTSGSWVVVETPGAAKAWTIHHANDVAHADFAISGRSTALTLGTPTTGESLSTLPTDAFAFRRATAHLNSRRLDWAELPVETPLEAGITAIELNNMVLGLTAGQPLVLSGERSDTPGVDASEVLFLDDIVHSGGKTTLLLTKGTLYGYLRETVSINANVIHATHGESTQEMLGSGNAAIPNQTFVLSKPPLTYISAPTPRGSASTLVVRINGVQWAEASSLYGVPANEQVYVVRIDDDARPYITFGDGIFGARTLTGSTNVTASYRSGIGPDGEVDSHTLTLLRTMPLGLRGVTNALPAGGAEAPERLADARRNAPRTVLTFDRVVSLLDYEDFARTFPGIGKALADVLWVEGESVIHVTVGGATGGAPGADTLSNLILAVGSASDSSQRFIVSAFAQRYFTTEIQVVVDPRHVRDTVLSAVEETVRAAFSFDARQFGQAVTAAEMLKFIHQVPGVIAATLVSLVPYTDEDPATAGTPPETDILAPVVARRARWNKLTRTAEPAELLLVNPVGITVEEMPS